MDKEFEKKIESIPYQKLKDMFPHSNHRVKGMMIEKILQLPFTPELVKQINEGTFKYPKLPSYESLKLQEMRREWQRINEVIGIIHKGKLKKKELFHKLFFDYKDVYVHPVPRWRISGFSLIIDSLASINIKIVKKDKYVKREMDQIYEIYYHVFNKTRLRQVDVFIYPVEVFELLQANLIQMKVSEDNVHSDISNFKEIVEENLLILNNLVNHFSFQYKLEWEEGKISSAKALLNLILVSPLVYTEREIKEIEQKSEVPGQWNYINSIIQINRQLRVFLPMRNEKDIEIIFRSADVHVYFKLDELTQYFKTNSSFSFCLKGCGHIMNYYIKFLINIFEHLKLDNRSIMYDIRRILASEELHIFLLENRRKELSEADQVKFVDLIYKDADLSPLCSEDIEKKEKYIEIYNQRKDHDKLNLNLSLQKYIVRPLANIVGDFIFKKLSIKDVCL